MSTLVIAGGGYAGRCAFARLCHLADHHDLLLVDPRETFVERVRLHQTAGDGIVRAHDLRSWVEAHGGRFVRAAAVGLEGDELALSSGETVRFDHLILSVGSTARRTLGAEAHRVGTAEQARALHLAVDELQGGARVVVVGSGMTALETAAELAWRGPELALTLIGRGWLEQAWSDVACSRIRSRLAALNIRLIEGTSVEGMSDGVVHALDGMPADLVVDATGFVPSPFAKSAGLPTDGEGRVLVDDCLRVLGRPHILAAGDAAVVAGRPLRMGCVVAMPMGCHAADVVRAQIEGRTPPAFGFSFPARNLALGGSFAVGQLTDAEDRPTRVLPEWIAGGVKELIGRATVAMPRWEASTGLRLYSWRGQGTPLQLTRSAEVEA